MPKKSILVFWFNNQVALCLDGSSSAYFDAAIECGCMPWLTQLKSSLPLSQGEAMSVMPSLTNPNNLAIITGLPPSQNGICGNYFLDPKTKEAVMMNNPSFLTCSETVLSSIAQHVPVTVITAKDKLHKLLSFQLPSSSHSFSIEKLTETAPQYRSLLPFPVPTIYDPDISTYLLQLGAKLLRSALIPSVFYLSTTDFVQHKSAPGTAMANQFFAKVDQVLAEFDAIGAVIGVTADHGMSRKSNIIFLESFLNNHKIPAQVILPITDPYVVHHGSFGSFASIYLQNPSQLTPCKNLLMEQVGIECVLSREEASVRLQLPADRIGDVVVIGSVETALGKTESFHDLSQVSELRSHGGFSETLVPLFFNRPLKSDFAQRLQSKSSRNFHLFDFLFNGIDE